MRNKKFRKNLISYQAQPGQVVSVVITPHGRPLTHGYNLEALNLANETIVKPKNSPAYLILFETIGKGLAKIDIVSENENDLFGLYFNANTIESADGTELTIDDMDLANVQVTPW